MAGDLPTAASDPNISVEWLLRPASGEGEKVVTLERPVSQRAPARVLMPRSRPWSRFAVAAALLVSVASAAIWSTRDGQRFGLPKSYSTAHGERRVQRLPDGSVVHLNTDSEVTVRYSARERVVELGRGQAVFEVAHESPRQFRVAAGPAGVIAVGTRFDVYRKPWTVTVTVVEGRVLVYTGTPPSGAAAAGPRTLQLGAGYQVELGASIGVPRPVDARSVIAWLEGKIVFENRALGEVAAEFNRYGPMTLEIEDPSLRALRISGTFDAYDTDSFAAFLAKLGGVAIQKTPTRIQVRSLAATSPELPPIAR